MENNGQTRNDNIIENIKRWAKKMKYYIATLYIAYKHKLTPWYAKVIAIITVGYALSPVDLIPDFIPVIGFIDDAILLPALIWLSLKLIPPDIINVCKGKAEDIFFNGKPKNYVAGVIIVLIWLSLISILVLHFMKK